MLANIASFTYNRKTGARISAGRPELKPYARREWTIVILYLVCILIAACIGLRYAGRGRFFEDCLARDKIQPIKGIFILLIFASHFYQYVELKSPLSQPYVTIKVLLGQLVVAPFLFYSGFGVAESVRRKGRAYVRSMPLRRILKVLFQFDLAILLFYFVQLALGNHYSLGKLLLSFVGWAAVGNSNWYIFAILSLYLISFLVCFVFLVEEGESAQKRKAFFITVLTLLLIWVLKRHRPSYCYNTLLAFPAGWWLSIWKERLFSFSFRSDKVYYFLFALLALILYALRRSWKSLAAYECSAVVFSLLLVFMTAKLEIRSRILRYCGDHLFSLFILQRLPMLVLARTPLKTRVAPYFLLSLAISFLLSWLFDLLVPKAWKRIEEACTMREKA